MNLLRNVVVAEVLISAVPIADPFVEEKREDLILKGEVASLLHPSSGCHFHPRCTEANSDCSKIVPPLCDVGNAHYVACIRV